MGPPLSSALFLPIMTMGNGGQSFARGPIYGAHRQKIRDTAERKPTAWERKLVGYNSLVIKYTYEKPKR